MKIISVNRFEARWHEAAIIGRYKYRVEVAAELYREDINGEGTLIDNVLFFNEHRAFGGIPLHTVSYAPVKDVRTVIYVHSEEQLSLVYLIYLSDIKEQYEETDIDYYPSRKNRYHVEYDMYA